MKLHPLETTLSKDTGGFILVAALSCLVILSFLMILAMTTSNVEKQIAHNLNLSEKTLARTDGVTEVGIEMIEYNLSCPLGFNHLDINDATATSGNGHSRSIKGVEVFDSAFAYDEEASGLAGYSDGDSVDAGDIPSDSVRSMRLASEFGVPVNEYVDNADARPHSNLAVYGVTDFGEGGSGSIIAAAGYDGAKKSTAGGGSTVINFSVWAQTFGINNSESIIRLQWQHKNGTEGTCLPY